jgi:hypothetical protein
MPGQIELEPPMAGQVPNAAGARRATPATVRPHHRHANRARLTIQRGYRQHNRRYDRLGKIVFGVLLLLLAVRNWRTRPAPGAEPEIPKLMVSVFCWPESILGT